MIRISLIRLSDEEVCCDPPQLSEATIAGSVNSFQLILNATVYECVERSEAAFPVILTFS